MEHGPYGPMTHFDSLTTTEELQMMKLMLPFTPASTRPMMAVFIKFQELQNAINIFRDPRQDRKIRAFEKKMDSPMDILEEMRPFMKEQDRSSLDMMLSAFSMMDMMNMASEASEGSGGSGGMDPMDMVKGMLSPEQQEAFESYNTMFAAEINPDEDVPESESKESNLSLWPTDNNEDYKGDE